MISKIFRILFYISAFIIILLFSSSNLLAQKCNYEKNEIDGLTELTIKRTTPVMLTRIEGQPLYAKGQCIGSNKYLKLIFYKYNGFLFQEQREIGFILSNNEEIVLYPRQMPVDSTKMDDITNVTSLIIYKLSEEQYKLLTEYPVIQFKYYVTSGFVPIDIKSSKQMSILHVLQCVK
jgi:hypothetical protein